MKQNILFSSKLPYNTRILRDKIVGLFPKVYYMNIQQSLTKKCFPHHQPQFLSEQVRSCT